MFWASPSRSGDLRVLAGRATSPGAIPGVGPRRGLGHVRTAIERSRRTGEPVNLEYRIIPRATAACAGSPREGDPGRLVAGNRAPDGHLHRRHRAEALRRGAARQRGTAGGRRRARRPRLLRGGLGRTHRLLRYPASRPPRHPRRRRSTAFSPWSSSSGISTPTTVQRVLRAAPPARRRAVQRVTIEYRYLHPARGERWQLHVARVATRDASDRTWKAYGVLRDITEQRQREEALRQSLRRSSG